MSDTRWRQVVRGWQQSSGGRTIEAKASADTLARMAIAVGVTAQQLEDVDREDAAEVLRRIATAPPERLPGYRPMLSEAGPMDDIEMINASRTMSVEQKLRAIQIILRLRKQREEEQAAEQQKAPADEAGAANGLSEV